MGLGASRGSELQIVMLGVAYAGNTTILYRLKLGKVVQTIPTIGFNVETVKIENVSVKIWDVADRPKLRPLWRHYFTNVQGVIYVVDSCADEECFEDSRSALFDYVLPGLESNDVPLVVFANKQDCPKAASAAEIMDKLQLNAIQDRRWCVQLTSAVTGEGIKEGVSRLVSLIKDRRQKTKFNARATT